MSYLVGKQENGMRREVILVALENRFSLARIPSLLYHAGCRVTVLGDANAPITGSRFVDRVIPCKIDPVSGGQALAKLLGEYGDARPWVIFGDEMALQAGILFRRENWVREVFPVDPGTSAEIILRKASFMTAAEKAGIPIPPMRICRTPVEADEAAEQLRFPLFLKRDVDCAGAGVVQIPSKAEVASAFKALSDTGPVVIQQTIHGRVGKTNAIYSRGRLMCHTSAYAKRTWPGQFGPSCVREYFCDPQLEHIAAAIGKMTGFNGLCGFDWIHDSQTGKFVVIEFNGRTIATYHLGKYVGVDYVQAVRDFVAGRMTIQEPHLLGRTRPVIHMFPQDVRRCISEKDMIGLGKWLFGAVETDMPWMDANLIFFFFLDFYHLGVKRVRRFFRRRNHRFPTATPTGVSTGIKPPESTHAMV